MIGDATTLAAAISGGQLTSAEAMEASILAAGKLSALGAVVSIDEDLGRTRAAAFDALSKDHPARKAAFAGVPTLVKDLGGPFRNLPTRAGSRTLPLGPKSLQSDLAARLETAGLMPFGLTTSPEFGLSLSSEPMMGPRCANPLEPRLSAGGSSGGAAAVVAAGIVAIAHATDAGGSIRVPAAACGLYGMKPGRGEMGAGPHYGNYLAGIASELAICRSTRDLTAIYRATRGESRGPFAEARPLAPAPSLRIGILTETGAHPTTEARAAAVEEAARALEAMGHRLVTVSISEIDHLMHEANRLFGEIVCINLAGLTAIPDFDLAKAEPLTQAAIRKGLSMSGTEVWQLTMDLAFVARDLHVLFDRFDILLAPMLTDGPRPFGSFPSDHGDIDLQFKRMADFAPLAALANISGCPALTLPFGVDAQGLPLPLQLFAPFGGEERLLSLSQALEDLGRWHHPFGIAGLDA